MIDCLSVEANSVTCVLGLRPTGNIAGATLERKVRPYGVIPKWCERER